MLTSTELVWLLAATAKGDIEAFERLYAATRSKLFGMLLRILRRPDLAEEVMQETYVRIWCSAGEFNPRLGTPITWIVAIARNRAFDALRKNTETSIDDEPRTIDAVAETRDALAHRPMTEQLRKLLACIAGLEDEHRRVLLLAYYNGWSREQLAAKFNKPVNTIKTWLRHGLLEIRDRAGE
ncbi:MAG TPA: sigma-70 family RNA polymerase sigma factor [Xanthobacteraceae bacterium]|nr:sigma-70 family RNA polymerase sigma factor [Xanthobacteraceae bacterium]